MPRPGDGPNPAMCNAQYSSQGGGDASIERRTQIRPGVWEFVLQFPDRRFVCRTDDRGRVLSFNPA